MRNEPQACEDKPDAPFLRNRPVRPPQYHCGGLFLMKCASARVDSTGIRQSGEAALFAAQLEWLMIPRIWALELDTKKSVSDQKRKLS